MNLPNKLTVFRVILIVPFVVLLLGGFQQWGWFTTLFSGILPYTDYIAVGIFIVASLTDLLDGKIARKYNLVTDFGKFMDPLADKLLVCSAMICLIEMGRLSAWIVIVIISREFIISGFRLVASDNGDYRGQLLGKIQDHFPDAYDHRTAAELWWCICTDRTDPYLDCPDPDCGIPGGLYCEE